MYFYRILCIALLLILNLSSTATPCPDITTSVQSGGLGICCFSIWLNNSNNTNTYDEIQLSIPGAIFSSYTLNTTNFTSTSSITPFGSSVLTITSTPGLPTTGGNTWELVEFCVEGISGGIFSTIDVAFFSNGTLQCDFSQDVECGCNPSTIGQLDLFSFSGDISENSSADLADNVSDIAEDPEGHIVVCGTVEHPIAPPTTTTGVRYPAVMKLDALGNVIAGPVTIRPMTNNEDMAIINNPLTGDLPECRILPIELSGVLIEYAVLFNILKSNGETHGFIQFLDPDLQLLCGYEITTGVMNGMESSLTAMTHDDTHLFVVGGVEPFFNGGSQLVAVKIPLACDASTGYEMEVYPNLGWGSGISKLNDGTFAVVGTRYAQDVVYANMRPDLGLNMFSNGHDYLTLDVADMGMADHAVDIDQLYSGRLVMAAIQHDNLQNRMRTYLYEFSQDPSSSSIELRELSTLPAWEPLIDDIEVGENNILVVAGHRKEHGGISIQPTTAIIQDSYTYVEGRQYDDPAHTEEYDHKIDLASNGDILSAMAVSDPIVVTGTRKVYSSKIQRMNPEGRTPDCSCYADTPFDLTLRGQTPIWAAAAGSPYQHIPISPRWSDTTAVVGAYCYAPPCDAIVTMTDTINCCFFLDVNSMDQGIASIGIELFNTSSTITGISSPFSNSISTTQKSAIVDDFSNPLFQTQSDLRVSICLQGTSSINQFIIKFYDQFGNERRGCRYSYGSCNQQCGGPSGPIIQWPDDITAISNDGYLPIITGSPIVSCTGPCGGEVIEYTDDYMEYGCEDVVIRTWLVIDDCGNVVTHEQTIEVVDITPPTIICAVDEVIVGELTTDFPLPDYDDEGGDVTLVFEDQVVDTEYGSILLREYLVVDQCGNVSECQERRFFLEDATILPLLCPPDVTLEFGEEIPYIEPELIMNCDNWNYTMEYVDDDQYLESEGLIVRTWIVSDPCGNTGSCTQQFFFTDTTPPVITCPSDIIGACGDDPQYWGMATATDNSGGPITITSTTVTDNSLAPCYVVHTITWTATDADNNTTSCIQTVTLTDTTAPTIYCEQSYSVNLGDPWSFGEATADDECTQATWTSVDNTVMTGCDIIHTRTWTPEDACGNVGASCTQTITEEGASIPLSISCPPDIIGLACENFDFTHGQASYTGGCEPVTLTVTTLPDFSTYPCINTQAVWTAMDSQGQSVSCTQQISVVDNTAPVLVSCPSDQTVDCMDPSLINVGVPVYSDNCTAEADIQIGSTDLVTVVDNCTQVITRSWTATDGCMNMENSCVTVITMTDITPPMITCDQDFTVECGTSWNFGTPTVSDNCTADPDIVVSSSDVVTPSGCDIYHTRTYTATDECGLMSTCTQTVTVTDSSPPLIVCPPDQILECGDPVDYGQATATDNCSATADILLSYTDNTVVVDPCTTVITVIWEAEDECMNISTCTQTITIMDTAPPTIQCPPDYSGSCDAAGNYGQATATDICSTVTISHSDVFTQLDNCTYRIDRTWTATDECQLSSSCVQQIDLVDTTPPVIVCPPDVMVECDNAGPYGTATATDDCGQTITIGFVDTEVGDICNKTITRLWTASDLCGNSSSCTQTITKTDSQGPVIDCRPPQIVECGSPIDNTPPPVADNCSGVASMTYADVEVSPPPCDQTIQRTWTAMDGCGNVSTCVETIIIRDTTPPQITCPLGISTTCEFLGQLAPATATDNCDTEMDFYYVDQFTGGPCNFMVMRTWTATDDCGNMSTCVQQIQVIDDTPPTIDCPGPIILNGSYAAGGATTTLNITATDECDSQVPVTLNIGEGHIFPCNTVSQVIATAMDDCGNTSTCTVDVQVICPPVINCPNGPVIATVYDLIPIEVGYVIEVEEEGCGGIVLEVEPPSGSLFEIGTTTVTATAIDSCGQVESCSFDVIVEMDSVTSINEQEIPGLLISPNPAHDIIRIRSENGLDKLTVVDMSGRKVEQYEGVAPSAQLTVIDWARGVYILEMTDGEGNRSRVRVVKE